MLIQLSSFRLFYKIAFFKTPPRRIVIRASLGIPVRRFFRVLISRFEFFLFLLFDFCCAVCFHKSGNRYCRDMYTK